MGFHQTPSFLVGGDLTRSHTALKSKVEKRNFAHCGKLLFEA